MHPRSRHLPTLEILESRYCPSLSIENLPGTLFISGIPTNAGGTGFTITGAGGTDYQVKDGMVNLGTYSTSNITLNLESYNEQISLNLEGQTLGGNVQMHLGHGNLGAFTNSITIDDGTIGGSVAVNGGSGNDNLDLGQPQGVLPIQVGGNVQFTGNNGAGLGDSYFLADNSRVGGNVVIATVPSVELGELPSNPLALAGATVGGTVNVNDSLANRDLALTINGATTIGKGLSVLGTPGAVLPGNEFVVQGTPFGTAPTINGNVVVNLGSGINLWALGGTYNGNVTLIGDNGTVPPADAPFIPADFVALDDLTGDANTSAQINGSLQVTVGNATTAFYFLPTGAISGNLSMNIGNAATDLGGGTWAGEFQGTVYGNVGITLGNGNNTATITSPAGGTLNLTNGNGANSVTFAPAVAGQQWKANVLFGNNANTFTLSPLGGILSGTVSGGASGVGNVFNQDPSWTFGPDFQLLNFP